MYIYLRHTSIDLSIYLGAFAGGKFLRIGTGFALFCTPSLQLAEGHLLLIWDNVLPLPSSFIVGSAPRPGPRIDDPIMVDSSAHRVLPGTGHAE